MSDKLQVKFQFQEYYFYVEATEAQANLYRSDFVARRYLSVQDKDRIYTINPDQLIYIETRPSVPF